jgi:predicted lipoprotein with Yx(FWY)xxD motif
VPRKRVVVPVFAGLALLAGCGATPAEPALIQPAAGAVQGQQVSVNAADVAGLGKVLTDQNGKTLYLFTKDGTNPPKSTCVGDCAEMWPPLLANGEVLASGVEPGRLGTVTRPDGTVQVTVGNWPVYMYAGDTGPGQATGQGLQDSWFAVTPEGRRAGAPAEAEPEAEPVAVVATDIPGFGSALTDRNGSTLYLFTKDSIDPPESTCVDDCAEQWPPLLTVEGQEVEVTGVDPDLMGTVTRPDGSEQVTVGGWPVYLYAKDTEPGQTNGHGVNNVWFVIEEEGCKSTAPVQQPSETNPSEEADGADY